MNPMTRLYHRDVFWPCWVEIPKSGQPLVYSNHALTAGKDDGLGIFPNALPETFDVVEVETVGRMPVKWTIRFTHPTKPDRDVVIVLNRTFNPKGQNVRTVWVNSKTDTHKTLFKSRYAMV